LLNFHGREWTIIRLGKPCRIEKVIIDTNHYKGNYPESFQLEYTSSEDFENAEWQTLIPRSKLSPHIEESFENLLDNENTRFVKLIMIPDGGISRLRVFGTPTGGKRKRQ
jgi:allantoicase